MLMLGILDRRLRRKLLIHLSRNWLRFFTLCFYGTIISLILVFLAPIMHIVFWVFNNQELLGTDMAELSDMGVYVTVYLIGGILFFFIFGMMIYSFKRIFLGFKMSSTKDKIAAILSMLTGSMVFGFVWFYKDHIRKAVRKPGSWKSTR